jgi:hypothetical protein
MFAAAAITFLILSMIMLFLVFRGQFRGVKIPMYMLYLFASIIFIILDILLLIFGSDALSILMAKFLAALFTVLCVFEIHKRTKKKL